MKKIIDILLYPYRAIRDHIRYKRRIKELRKRDPFIYR
jgi:hypothetical protein